MTDALFPSQLDALATHEVVRPQLAASGLMDRLTEQLVSDWTSGAPGRQALCDDLLRVIVLRGLRDHIAQSDDSERGWIAGIYDPHIAPVLAAIHGKPAYGWQIPELAEIAGLARSTLSVRFKAKVGIAPIEYATRERMRAAAQMLDAGSSVAEAAAAVGLRSTTGFTVAFRRWLGVSPQKFKSRHQRR